MSYRRLTPEEIEELRAEMRASGQWIKAELAKRRREREETDTVETTASPLSKGEVSRSKPGDEQV
ncbi:hypothetical protein ACPF7Z_19275 [Halomonas sp. GXIMD04776]|uniref:hypothetical protein n=1 Tax=Halomonas sp. GXIMD04776 TaxID=3415605 RepID=UPI003CB84C4B